MTGYILTTEVGYAIYLGQIHIADVDTVAEGNLILQSTPVWNGKTVRGQSTYMPCQ